MRLTDILNEVTTYSLEKVEDRWSRKTFEVIYEFQTPQHSYFISFEGEPSPEDDDLYEVEVKYTAKGYGYDELTGEGSPIRIINTVVEATRKIEAEYGDYIHAYVLEGVMKADEDPMEIDTTQRARVYKRFYERAFPDASVEIQRNNVYVHL